jgi:hypothetical protein
MVFNLMAERYQGGTNHEYDGVEDAGLIDALRACSSYTEQIVCLNFDEVFVVQVEGIDGHNYFIQFSIMGPALSVHAARVRITKLSLLDGPEGREDGPRFTMYEEASHNTLNVLQDYSKRLDLGRATADRAFLIGMSMVIGFMDEQGEDQDEDARLAPLVAQVVPTSDELREIRAKLPPPSINYDEEGDLPY